MRPRRNTFNPNRKMRPAPQSDSDRTHLKNLAERAGYGGNPEHKRNPGDFDLSPPTSPKPDKSLCDTAGIFSRSEAVSLLREGIQKGLISVREKDGWPQNVWAVDKKGVPLEAQLENAGLGIYHGYPVPEADKFREMILKRWGQS